MHWVVVWIGFAFAVFVPGAAAVEPLGLDDIMWKDPPYTAPNLQYEFPKTASQLWALAMKRPESELRRAAADTVVIAQKRGMKGLEELADELAAILKASDQDGAVRRAAAHALVSLNASDHAPLLAETADKEGLEVAQFVEPALAKWKYSPIEKTWLERVDDPATRQLWRLLAIQCLAETKEKSAREPLLKIVHDRRAAPSIRLSAAQALAGIFSTGLVADAKQHLGDAAPKSATERLLGVTLLSHHSDSDAVAVLKQLATDQEPSIAGAALARLFAIDPKLVFELAPEAIKHADVNVRRVGAESLIVKADDAAIRQLTPLLGDVNPTLRGRVANAFAELAAKTELRNAIIEETERTLTQDSWRGLEKAILLAVFLERKNNANRMIELLTHPRPEVAVAAAWSLRRFALTETLAEMLKHAQLQFDRLIGGKSANHEAGLINGQHSQLFQAFGQMRYKEAEPLMRRFVPKNFTLGTDARAAACWALGYLHEDQVDEGLADQMVGRLSDVSSMMPELNPVRATCAVSLGRMKAQSAIPALERFTSDEGVTSLVGQSCWWSLERLTDKKRPPMPVLTQRILGWFLQAAE